MSNHTYFFHDANDDFPDDDDNWTPFPKAEGIDDDIPPEVTDAELHEMHEMPNEYDAQFEEENFDQMPIVEETPPQEKKSSKQAKPDKASATVEKNVQQRINNFDDFDIGAKLDEVLGYSVSTESSKSKKKAPAATSRAAPRAVKGNKPKAMDQKDIEEHQSLLIQIDRYRMNGRFEDTLRTSGLRLTGCEGHSIEELKDLLTRVRTVIGCRASAGGSVLGSGILMATGVAEQQPIVKRFADIEGLSAMLSQNPEFLDITEQLSIDYSFMSVMSPEKRLALLMLKSGVTMNAINKMKKSVPQQAQQQPAAAAPVAPAAPAASIQRPVDIRALVRPVYSDDILEY